MLLRLSSLVLLFVSSDNKREVSRKLSPAAQNAILLAGSLGNGLLPLLGEVANGVSRKGFDVHEIFPDGKISVKD